MGTEGISIDGVSVGRSVSPNSVAELAAAIADEKGAIVPRGSGTQMEFGNPLRAADCVVDLSGLSRITTYNPAELTIHVEAGATLGQLQSALAPNKQALPLDPWNGPSATIGGIAAANAQGPMRAIGGIRDWIIGMTVVHVDGRVSKTGGKVVKNVTGYDLAKLYTGSLGSLTVIAEISFKLKAQFPKTSTAIAEFQNLQEALVVLGGIRKSPLQPIACELVGGTGAGNAIWIRFGEHPAAVAWQNAQLPKADWKVVEGDLESAAWERLRLQHAKLGPVVVRVVGRPSETGTMIEQFRPVSWIAHAASGIVLMAFDNADGIERIRDRFPAVIEKAPLDVRRRVGTFGVRGTEKRLIQEMKQKFDPSRRLNPGRHIDGE
ncbi:MAG TPA: FAD-binding oxidoreductase [Terriglobia bacterium]|nr:FAD-binding oxidoreductase [Terriglobia bacterium]